MVKVFHFGNFCDNFGQLSATELLFPQGFAFCSTSVFHLFSLVFILPLKRHKLYAQFIFLILLKPCKYQETYFH